MYWPLALLRIQLLIPNRLMVVLKRSDKITHWLTFNVQVLEAGAEQWKEAGDIGNSALFVGVNGSLCVSTREHAGLKAGRVYFTDAELEHAAWRTDERNRYLYRRRGFQKRCIGVYDLKSGRLKKVRSPVEPPSFWPPAAWFTPSTAVST